MKYIGIAVLVLLVTGSWFKFHQSGNGAREMQEKIEMLYNEGDAEDEVPALKTELNSMEGERTFNGILLSFLSAGLVGIVFVVWLLPILAHKLTHAVYDSGEQVETDPFYAARVMMAQGEWEQAIEAFKLGAQQDPLNRMPWVEISNIQKTHLEDSLAAIATLREAIQEHEWEEDDVAFLMFRLAEVYDENAEDRAAAAAILEQVMEQFPDSRHSANARSKLHEWGMA